MEGGISARMREGEGVTTRGRGIVIVGVLGCRCKGVSLRELREMLLRNERRKKGGENFIKSVIVFLLNNGRSLLLSGQLTMQANRGFSRFKENGFLKIQN